MTDSKRIELEALITEREAYIAGNKLREVVGESPMYGPEDFFELADRIRRLNNDMDSEKSSNS